MRKQLILFTILMASISVWSQTIYFEEKFNAPNLSFHKSTDSLSIGSLSGISWFDYSDTSGFDNSQYVYFYGSLFNYFGQILTDTLELPLNKEITVEFEFSSTVPITIYLLNTSLEQTSFTYYGDIKSEKILGEQQIYAGENQTFSLSFKNGNSKYRKLELMFYGPYSNTSDAVFKIDNYKVISNDFILSTNSENKFNITNNLKYFDLLGHEVIEENLQSNQIYISKSKKGLTKKVYWP